jgi:hypothetical protein
MINISENIVVLSPGDNFIESPDALKIYLAGCMSIAEGDAFDWQSKFINGLQILTDPSSQKALLQFKGRRFVICNPRSQILNHVRSMENPEFVLAQNWKMDAIEYCDGIFCNFLKKSTDVLPLMEFGYIVRSGKAVVRCPSEYIHEATVRYMCQRFQIPLLPEGRAGDVLSVLQTMFSYIPGFQQIQGLQLPE